MAALMIGSMLVVALLVANVPGLCNGELERFEYPIKSDSSLSFLVVGDWGRKGGYNQSAVAVQMGIKGEKLDVDFIISTGDNFYESFTRIYSADSLQKQWYGVLGNHDYRGDVLAQLSPVLRKIDSRWLCLRSFILDAEIVDFFFVDTTPFGDKYFTEPGSHVYDWRGILPRDSYISNLLKANDVDLYINGHEHCLQHISTSDSPIQFLTSGGGSKAWRGVSWPNPEELKFYYDGQGFMAVQMTETQVDIAFYDIFGNVLHKWGTSKPLFSIVGENSRAY
ncbi:hypothetical protein SAY86_017521 [Trapa natans]|uniref:acid phosphatase n=1 Tax=Trapa natans TaxID=22666 RepID=A0AAN7R556_TRANT|nr:hypothetical protein SAY86_017521 [Trapa natans]